jgi:hypothetical protein
MVESKWKWRHSHMDDGVFFLKNVGKFLKYVGEITWSVKKNSDF